MSAALPAGLFSAECPSESPGALVEAQITGAHSAARGSAVLTSARVMPMLVVQGPHCGSQWVSASNSQVNLSYYLRYSLDHPEGGWFFLTQVPSSNN